MNKIQTCGIFFFLVSYICMTTSFGVDIGVKTTPLPGIQHSSPEDLILDYDFAVDLASLPLQCYNQEYPYKDAIVLESADYLALPKENHPAFYGCFDWHSSVHGHWLLATVARRYPKTELADNVTAVFNEQFREEKILKELKVFQADDHFERTYGWAWLLKLQQELLLMANSDDFRDDATSWSLALQPLSDHIVNSYMSFLPNLVYPVRVGEHSNTAFGLIFALEYAEYIKDKELIELISGPNVTGKYFSEDRNCPIDWEPSGFDFLSPCLQEADAISRMPTMSNYTDFHEWLNEFMPGIYSDNFTLTPGEVKDSEDGKLVHLHGVNFSRAWNLYSLATRIGEALSSKIYSIPSLNRELTKARDNLMNLGDEHMNASIDQVIGSHYMSSHWLATFITYALQLREIALEA